MSCLPNLRNERDNTHALTLLFSKWEKKTKKKPQKPLKIGTNPAHPTTHYPRKQWEIGEKKGEIKIRSNRRDGERTQQNRRAEPQPPTPAHPPFRLLHTSTTTSRLLASFQIHTLPPPLSPPVTVRPTRRERDRLEGTLDDPIPGQDQRAFRTAPSIAAPPPPPRVPAPVDRVWGTRKGSAK